MSDPDGGMLKTEFRLYDGVQASHSGPRPYVQENVGSGSFSQVTVPAPGLADGNYFWNVMATDGQATTWSTVSCEFEVDSVKPSIPAVSSSDYPTTGVNGSVGRTGVFTFSPNGNTGLNGSMDVAYYKWSINTDAKNNRVDVTSTDGTVAVPITPPNELQNVLYVQAYDRADNPSSNHAVYTFAVASAAGPVASWEVTETSGTTVADSSGNGRPLQLVGGSSLGVGYAGSGLTTGNGGYAASAAPIVRTDRAFAVAAWVKIDNVSGYVTVASQSGNRVSGFYLQYSADVNRWTMSVIGADVDNPPGLVRVKSALPPQVGVWTHLIGTYEPNSKTVSLYVNGKLEGTGTATLWNAQAGGFLVGAAKWNGSITDFFPGTIDQVQVWDRTIGSTEAAQIANKWFSRMRYRLDETTGTTAPDTVGNYTGTLSGGVSWAGTPVDPDDPNQVLSSEDKWARFDTTATGQIAASKGSKFRADRSYTVMSWVRLTDKSDTRAVLAMDHPGHSPFYFGYRQDSDKWCMVTLTSTGASPVQACSDHLAALHTWVHLAATYDMVTGKISLFVNGSRQSTFYGTVDGGGVAAWQPDGGFLIGRGQLNGAITQPWRGDLDDVRIYTGVLSGAEILARNEESMHG
ncbi:LamG domain-containing protein [Actinokineospora sp.]|uniref:LamG domain-containing protein n=1 Tax=Actinokineospora sp. TaxID=1872133 RepID=UPI003D6A9777